MRGLIVLASRVVVIDTVRVSLVTVCCERNIVVVVVGRMLSSPFPAFMVYWMFLVLNLWVCCIGHPNGCRLIATRDRR